MSLLQELNKEDREIMENYISAFGVKADFIGLDEWLKYWNHSKKRLYKLLGNQLIYKIPFKQEKSREALRFEIQEKLLTLPFRNIYHEFYISCIRTYKNDNIISKETADAFSSITNWENFLEDKITKTIKMKKPESRKMLQIQKGMKPIRALQKIKDYFKEEFQKACEFKYNGKEDLEKAFEKFRLTHSMIFNDKTIKGKLCISIHPMDFITMSDNDSDWSSCMSWIDEGCYKIGSVEMMNSNNVLCCYVESSKPFLFESYNKKWYDWNNKKWRVLLYFNNDIIMSGKAYPYANDELCKTLISTVKDLAEKNLYRYYSFGPELYKDMLHIDSLPKMNNNRFWMQHDDTKKNIIWDTKGMYNDMLNDTKTNYWCYRNKVKHKKIFSVSGKAPCLCCGEPVIEYDEDEIEYNDRYSNVSNLFCFSCEQERSCDSCENIFFGEPLYYINKTTKYCKHCFEKYIKTCPCCGKPFRINTWNTKNYYFKNKYASFKHIRLRDGLEAFYDKEWWNSFNEREKKQFFETIYLCKDCKPILKENYKNIQHKLGRAWSPPEGYTVFLYNEELFKYKYKNLKTIPLDSDLGDLN